MKPIATLDADTANHLVGVLFDLDDTLLDHGRLTEGACSALWRLHEAGLKLMPVTGRPSGWADVLTRIWPIDGMVTENGTIALLRRADGSTYMLDEVGTSERAERRERVLGLVSRIRERFDFAVPATDVHLRRADFTFDIGETRTIDKHLVDQVEDYARGEGARTVRSSVHLHVSFDGSDKGSGAVRAIVAGFGLDATSARGRFAFIGDSENDEPAFSTFLTTIGVRNLRGRPTVTPKYLTEAERGKGFAEFSAHLLQMRAQSAR
ncbi:MAG: HAD-IIB family hydrolase [Polyangiaceae bacterium]